MAAWRLAIPGMCSQPLSERKPHSQGPQLPPEAGIAEGEKGVRIRPASGRCFSWLKLSWQEDLGSTDCLSLEFSRKPVCSRARLFPSSALPPLALWYTCQTTDSCSLSMPVLV